jgi:hypothetical protein
VHPEWHILASSMLRAIAYDAEDRKLVVRFASGTVYRYHDVPQQIAEALLDPPGGSSGRYFNDHVRDSFDYDDESR